MKRSIVAILLLIAVCFIACDRKESLEKGPVLVGVAGSSATWHYYEETDTLVIRGQGAIDRDFCEPLFFRTTICHLVIEEGITEIKSSAFEGCSSLISVSFPKSLIILGGRAFYECASLKEAVFPGIVIIEMRAFKGCTALTKIVLPESASQIYPQVFEDCPNLTDVKVPPHLEEWAKANGFRG
jgi:hypothetical protein